MLELGKIGVGRTIGAKPNLPKRLIGIEHGGFGRLFAWQREIGRAGVARRVRWIGANSGLGLGLVG